MRRVSRAKAAAIPGAARRMRAPDACRCAHDRSARTRKQRAVSKNPAVSQWRRFHALGCNRLHQAGQPHGRASTTRTSSKRTDVLDRRWRGEWLAVGDAADRAAQDLARAGLRQTRHHAGVLEGGDRADALAHQGDQFSRDIGLRAVRAGLQHDEAERRLTLQLVGHADDGAFGDIGDARRAPPPSRRSTGDGRRR